MKVLLTGGGTGGHITPILAVAHELKRQHPATQVIYIGERGGKFRHLTDKHPDIDVSYSIFSGKFRRYYKEKWLDRLLDVKTVVLNIRDFFYFVAGLIQSWFLLGRIKPDVVFLKGGFVGVPIGLAAAARRLPIITHDSDALPGLANRLVSRWVTTHTTGQSAENYPYDKNKTIAVGVLVEHTYKSITGELQKEYKRQLNLPEDALVLVITGGSLGARQINQAVSSIIDKLLAEHTSLHVLHQVGQGKAGVYSGYHHERLKVFEFMKPMYVYMGAADLVVTRASGNTMAELGVQGKACIVIPNPHLTGGHQLENARLLIDHNAAQVIYETDLYDNSKGLHAAINRLLEDKSLRSKLSENLQLQTPKNAASTIAQLLLENGKAKKRPT